MISIQNGTTNHLSAGQTGRTFLEVKQFGITKGLCARNLTIKRNACRLILAGRQLHLRIRCNSLGITITSNTGIGITTKSGTTLIQSDTLARIIEHIIHKVKCTRFCRRVIYIRNLRVLLIRTILQTNNRIIINLDSIAALVALIVNKTVTIVGNIVLDDNRCRRGVIIVKHTKATSVGSFNVVIAKSSSADTLGICVNTTAIPILSRAHELGHGVQVAIHINYGVVSGSGVLCPLETDTIGKIFKGVILNQRSIRGCTINTGAGSLIRCLIVEAIVADNHILESIVELPATLSGNISTTIIAEYAVRNSQSIDITTGCAAFQIFGTDSKCTAACPASLLAIGNSVVIAIAFVAHSTINISKHHILQNNTSNGICLITSNVVCLNSQTVAHGELSVIRQNCYIFNSTGINRVLVAELNISNRPVALVLQNHCGSTVQATLYPGASAVNNG